MQFVQRKIRQLRQLGQRPKLATIWILEAEDTKDGFNGKKAMVIGFSNMIAHFVRQREYYYIKISFL